MDDLTTSPYLAIVADQIEHTVTPPDGYAHAVGETCTTILRRLAQRPEAWDRSLRTAADHYRQILGDSTTSDDPTTLHERVGQLVHNSDARTDEARRELHRAVLLAERDRTTELLRSGTQSTDHREHPETGLDTTQRMRLQEWLRAELGHQIMIGDVREIAGGFSKRTLFVNLSGHPDLTTVVLRVERDFNILGTSLAHEFPFVKHVSEAKVPAPRAIGLGSDPSILGHQFVVYSHMPGEQIGDIDGTTRGSASLASDLAAVLGRLHSVPLDGLAAADETPSPSERMRTELEAFEARWIADGSPTLTLAVAFDWLRHNLALADGEPVIVHRDVGWHNMLVADDRVTALLDWEMATIGAAAQDLGYVYLTATALTDWPDFLAAYEAATGRQAPDQQQINFFRVWREVWRCSNVRHAKRQIEVDGDREFRLSAGVVIKLDGLELRLQELLLEVMDSQNLATAGS